MKRAFIKVTVLNLLLAAAIPAIAEETNPEPIPSGFPSKGESINARLDRLAARVDNKDDHMECRMNRRAEHVQRRTQR
ncbi:MAG: hypothetical protein KAT06_00520 [Gammaproteobacteria bacterium]|nr:hypothetical protein [Gammaproteobacteria bacterium]